MTGCGKPENPLKDDTLALLVDTVQVGENREVFLTDMTGGFFYDNALGDPLRGEYGYSRLERKFIAGWQVLDLVGDTLDLNGEVSLVHPHFIERTYDSGLIERVECPFRQPGLLIDLEVKRHKQTLFRPQFDFRSLAEESSGEYSCEWNDEECILSVSLMHGTNGWVSLQFPAGSSFLPGREIERIYHDLGVITGRVSVSLVDIEGDILIRGGKATVAMGWGESREQSIAAAAEIMRNRKQTRADRIAWMQNIIDDRTFYCENRKFEAVHAWAELSLASLIYEAGNETFMLSGIPFNPCPDGWNTLYAIPGIVELPNGRQTAVELVRAVINRQNTDSLSVNYGMFPGKISGEEIEYRIPEISGLVALALEKVFPGAGKRAVNQNAESDTTRILIEGDTTDYKAQYKFLDECVLALLKDLLGTTENRIHAGFVLSDAKGHCLWDGPTAPDRAGATIESQLLLSAIRNYLMDYRRLQTIAPDIPQSLLSYRSAYSSVTIFSGSSEISAFTSTPLGEFSIPLDFRSSLSAMQDRRTGNWGDLIRINYNSQTEKYTPTELDTTPRMTYPVFLGLLKENDRKASVKILDVLYRDGYLGEAGIRSLAEIDKNYEPEHLYYDVDSPCGTMSKGDVLLWTSYPLSRFMFNDERWDSLGAYTERLTDRLLIEGVIGGLHEAESNLPDVKGDKIVGNGVFASSLAGLVWIYNKALLSFDPRLERYLELEPRVPPGWGSYYIERGCYGGKVWIERIDEYTYKVGQRAIKPNLRIKLGVIIESGRETQQSLRLYPGDSVLVEFSKTDDGYWKGKVTPL